MQVTILGYWGGYPSAGGATAGYLITTDEGTILLDCGSGVMSRLPFYTNVESISGVILSHLHYDHMADIGILQYAAVGALRTGRMKERLQIYAPDQPEDMLKKLHGVHSDIHVIEASRKVTIAGAEIEFIPVLHTIPCYAVKISYKGKVFAYSADTSYCESLIDFAKEADMFLCEATICEGSHHTTGEGHMNAGQAGTIAKKANVKKLVLTHLPHDGNFEFMKQTASEAFGRPVYIPNITSNFTL
ncbi:MBL fold metallo-hydrolase [Paenibacillus thalictri]|uniref:MBL fold metallo-hydrolase n=1 Tax=Paenibacillus thalictri TaxID=2527873 RepID=A0A4V6MSJ7_9BACL|nr:MBL fold metallo-hydrolase [Paenibacillus thalictri]TBL81672.1 MBL fold metallo-hydrolase [Paenibacillus thalictri]